MSDPNSTASMTRVPTEFPKMEPRPQLTSDWIDWRSGCSSIQELNAHMLETGLYSDVAFLIEDANKDEPTPPIKAHQFVLRSRSPVFETMFAEIWNKPATEEASGDNANNRLEVKLVDTTSEQIGRASCRERV